MSEEGFRLFHQLLSMGAELLYAGGLALFLRPFMQPAACRRGPAVAFLCHLLCWLVCNMSAAPQGAFGLGLVALLAALARPVGLGRPQAFLLPLFYANARVCAGLIAESLYFILERHVPFHYEPLEAVYLRAALLAGAFIATHGVLFLGMLYLLGRRLQKRPLALHLREVCYMALLPTAGVLFGQMVSRLLFEVKDGALLQLYERHPAFLAVVPLLALLFYGGSYLTVTAQQGMAALQEESAALFAQHQQARSIQARLQEVEQLYTHIRALKHDLRGHLAALKGLASSGEYEGLSGYIDKMDESIGQFNMALQTGSPVTDIIINDAQQQALQAGITLEVDFHCPGPGAYDAFDLGIILQNLLQNALEACGKVPEGQRFITLAGRKRGHFFLIEVENAAPCQVPFGPDGLPATTKGDATLHGIGLKSVRRAAEGYQGELELKSAPGMFSATVLLQERRNT